MKQMTDENKICFILCVNNDLFFYECVRYIQSLIIPPDMEIEILEIREAASMAAGYNEGMNSTNAKYKVYMHQDVFLVNRNFLGDIISIFKENKDIGMIGLTGNEKLPERGIMWLEERVYLGTEIVPWDGYRYEKTDGMWDVACIDGLCMVTQYDIPWREDIFDGWDFYDMSQSCEFRKRGYHIVVPVQKYSWYVHDDKPVLQLWDYNKYRKRWLEEYTEMREKRNADDSDSDSF